jgi:glycosyltransferase involved in cell wall biosynthesis
MRIAHVNAYFYPYMGGIEHRIHNVSRRLAKDHDVFVVTSRLDGTVAAEDKDGYHIVRQPTRYIGNYNPPIAMVKGVDEALKGIDPDVIDFHYRWSPGLTRAVLKQECPIVYTCHNVYGEGNGAIGVMSRVNDWLFKRHARRFARVAYVSEYLMRDFMEHGFPTEGADVVPNGVDLKPTAEVKDHIMTLSRMVGTKGLDVLVDAMRHVDCKLVMCGDGPIRPKLQRLVEDLGLRDRVTLPGRVTEEEKARLMASCQTFIVPSTYEAFGIVAVEAMAYGRPVIASRTGGLVEVVGDGGMLVPPGDSKALAEAINAMLADRERRDEYGARARQRAALYSWERATSGMMQCYQKAIAEARTDRAAPS